MLDQLVHSLWLAPLVACMVIVAIHSYLGLHVIAREVIFVDLSLAQMAALGSTIAIFAGAEVVNDGRLAFRRHPEKGAGDIRSALVRGTVEITG